MAKEFDGKEFWRITGGVFLIGVGISVVGIYLENLGALLFGLASVAIGLGLLFMKYTKSTKYSNNY